MPGYSNIQVLKQLLRPIVLKRDNLRRKAGRRDAWTNKFSQDVSTKILATFVPANQNLARMT